MKKEDIQKIIDAAQARLLVLHEEERSLLNELELAKYSTLASEILPLTMPVGVSRLYVGEFSVQNLGHSYQEQAYLAGRIELCGFSTAISRVLGSASMKPCIYRVVVALIEA